MLPTTSARSRHARRFFDNGPALIGENSWISAVLAAVILTTLTAVAADIAARQAVAYVAPCASLMGNTVCQAPTVSVWWVGFIAASSTVLVIASLLCAVPRFVLRRMKMEKYYVDKFAEMVVRHRFGYVWTTVIFMLAAVVTLFG